MNDHVARVMAQEERTTIPSLLRETPGEPARYLMQDVDAMGFTPVHQPDQQLMLIAALSRAVVELRTRVKELEDGREAWPLDPIPEWTDHDVSDPGVA